MQSSPADESEAATASGDATDLVLEGGGVKGIALVGAVLPFAEAGYRFPRVSGTSAGAMVAALLAAMQRSGEPPSRLVEIARSADYTRFRDRGRVASRLGPLKVLADGLSLVRSSGIYEGDYLRDWMAGVLRDLGVVTFGDLRSDDIGGDDAIHHRYRLVVTASDVSRQRFVRLPWDYADYGVDPDEQRVAEAVRASTAIPFFYEPATVRGPRGVATLVDGGLLSNYPIGIFDRLDEHPPRWPTIGIRLTARSDDRPPPPRPVRDPVTMGLSLLETALEGRQAVHRTDPCNIARSVFVDTTRVSAVDFEMTPEQQELLLAEGRAASERFLSTWSYRRWLEECRGVGSP